MEIREFEDWLRKGLGRVLLFLQNHDARPYRAAILHACTHDLAYDRQVEDARGQYLFEIIQQTGEPGFYRDIVLTALDASKSKDEESIEYQLFEIVRQMAAQGDDEARSVMRHRFALNADVQDYTGAEDIVLLDGLDGFRFVAEHLAGMDFEADGWELESWIEILEERFGKAETWDALQKIAQEVAHLAGLLEAVQAKRTEKHEELRAQPSPALNFEAVRQLIVEKTQNVSKWTARRWSRTCQDEAEIERAAQALLAEEDRDRLPLYLNLFYHKKFPLDPGRLVTLARDPERKIAWSAQKALRHIRHPAVRAFALELKEEPIWCGNAVELLSANYEAGDERLIESLLARTIDADDYHHYLGIAVRDFFKAHPQADSTAALLLLYERGPCMLCRGGVVRMLLERNQMPDWMREECRYDADLDIRKQVEA